MFRYVYGWYKRVRGNWLKTIYTLKFILSLISCILFVSCGNNDTKFNFQDEKRAVINFSEPDISNLEAKMFFNNGLKCVEKSKFKEARDFFKKAEELEPDNVVILINVATAESSLGNYVVATAIFEKALAIDSTYIGGYANYGRLLNKTEEYEDAVNIYNKALNLKSTTSYDKALVNYGIAISYLGLKECEKSYQHAELAKSLFNHEGFHDQVSELIELVNRTCMEQ